MARAARAENAKIEDMYNNFLNIVGDYYLFV